MDKRILIIGGVVLAGILAVVVTLLLNGGQKSNLTPSPIEALSPSPTISPTARDPKLPPDPAVDESLPDFTKQFPIAERLPRYTPFWGLRIDGEISNGKIPLRATVYYAPGADSRSVTESQKPYIEAFIKSTNQAEGSYKIEYDSKLVERD